MASKFTQELFDTICNELATTAKGLHVICRNNNLNPATFYDWIRDNVDLNNRYVHAREAQTELLADQIVEIADDSSQDLERIDDFGNKIENKEFVSRSRLRVDARKWIAAKLLPKKYGDKVDVTSGGEPIKPVDLTALVGTFMKPDEGHG